MDICELNSLESDKVRQEFITSFIDVKSEYYKKYVQNKKLCSDGYCYDGYLWECLKNYIIVTQNNALEKLVDKNRVLIMWDISSIDRIYIKDYFKFGKNVVLKCTADFACKQIKNDWNIYDGSALFPEDIYIFDKTFEWYISFTHEERKKGRRLCLTNIED